MSNGEKQFFIGKLIEDVIPREFSMNQQLFWELYFELITQNSESKVIDNGNSTTETNKKHSH